jgi:hypothetical protein
MVCKIYNIDTGHMVVACDNKSAGQKAINWHYSPKPSNDHFDMLKAIHQLQQLLPITRSSGMSKLTNAKSRDLGKLLTNGSSGMMK